MYVSCAFCSTSAPEAEAKELKSRENSACGGTAEDATRGVCSRGEDVKRRFGVLLRELTTDADGAMYCLPADNSADGLTATRHAVSTMAARCGAGLVLGLVKGRPRARSQEPGA